MKFKVSSKDLLYGIKFSKILPQVNKKVEIVYTGITADNAAKKSITALDGIISSDINTCTHLVTDKVHLYFIYCFLP